MARILTGIQATGRPHLGNLLGAIEPAVRLSARSENESFLFIADLHSLTTIKNPQTLEENTRAVALAWLASGLDTEKSVFYRQSRLAPFHTELTWYLNCLTPYPMLANAHSFKDKSEKLADVNAGLFTYPVLMTADIILYQADYVPVGKDQKQHLEMARDLADVFNRVYGEVFKIPEAVISEEVMTIPGIDGQKMSKSYNNYIDIFLPENELYKVIKKIVSDATPLEAPKNPDTDNTFKIFSLVGTPEQVEEMRKNYLAGGYGYGHAKKALYEAILARFAKHRQIYAHYLDNPEELDKQLKIGEEKAADIAAKTIMEVRKLMRFV